jgi:hypothetical protein
MKKTVVRSFNFKIFEKPIASGILFSGVLLIMSLFSKFFRVFDGFVGIFLNMFSEFGYDLNLFGIFTGVICAFLTAFCLSYLYLLLLNFFRK